MHLGLTNIHIMGYIFANKNEKPLCRTRCDHRRGKEDQQEHNLNRERDREIERARKIHIGANATRTTGGVDRTHGYRQTARGKRFLFECLVSKKDRTALGPMRMRWSGIEGFAVAGLNCTSSKPGKWAIFVHLRKSVDLAALSPRSLREVEDRKT